MRIEWSKVSRQGWMETTSSSIPDLGVIQSFARALACLATVKIACPTGSRAFEHHISSYTRDMLDAPILKNCIPGCN